MPQYQYSKLFSLCIALISVFFQEMARKLNDDSPICVDISANFSNMNHLLKCKNRHFFKSDMILNEPQFARDTQCLVEILHVVSPIWFEVRIYKYKKLNEDWIDWNSSEQFDQFSKDLNESHTKSFTSVGDISEVDKNTMFVLRKGSQFSRCTILDTK